MDFEGVRIERGAHGCVLVRGGGKLFVVDPLMAGREKADVILITHDHPTHLSLPDIAAAFTPSTTVVIPPVAHPPLLHLGQDINHLVVMGPEESYDGEGWTVRTVPSYTLTKQAPNGKPAHPRADELLGYLLELAGKRLYVAGDTDLIPEMGELKRVDVAFLPVSGRTVMTAEEAAKAADTIKPRLVVPIHWGSGEGGREDALRFKELASCDVVVL